MLPTSTTGIRQRRILVVEDDPDMMCFVQKALASVAPDVVMDTACGVRTALSRLAEHEYSLVLADYLLEDGRPGLMLREIVRLVHPGTHFTMMSSLPLAEHLRLSGEPEMDVLRKPFTLGNFQGFLRALL